MLDIKLIRSNPDYVKACCKKREKDMDAVIDEILDLDEQRRAATAKVDAMKAEQNAASREIPKIKKEGGDVSAIMAKMKELSATVKDDYRN